MAGEHAEPARDVAPDEGARRPGRGRRVRRRIVLAALVGTTLVVAASLIAGESSGWPFLRDPLQRLVVRAASVPLLLEGHFRVRFVPAPRLEVDHLRVGPAHALAVPHLLDARRVHVAWRWSDLWQWWRGAPLRLRALGAATLDARLVRLEDGRASWHVFADRDREDGPGRAPAAGSESRMQAPWVPPSADSLSVGRARLSIDDRIGQARLEVTVRGSEGAVDIGRSERAASGNTTAGGGVEGGFEASATGQYRQWPVQLRLHADSAQPLL